MRIGKTSQNTSPGVLTRGNSLGAEHVCPTPLHPLNNSLTPVRAAFI